MSWSEGYTSEIDYTFGYYQELNPSRIALPLIATGIKPPRVTRACELGFGQGVSLNINAASSEIQWYGNDFNPNQALFAQQMAEASGSKAICTDQSFEQFCAREDLPQFDFIGLHGIWSWISDKNRAILARFFERNLAVGGVVYIGYNTLPGWSEFAPVRNLMAEHLSLTKNKQGSTQSQLQDTFKFMQKVMSSNPIYARGSKHITQRLSKMKEHGSSYLIHEYFNKDWHPMYFSEIAEIMNSCKLQYACSAHYNDLVDSLNLLEEQKSLLSSIESVNFRETIRNFFTNQPFRRDYWVKGKIKLTRQEQKERLLSLRFILCKSSKAVEYKTVGSLGEAKMEVEKNQAIISVFSDYSPHSIAEVQEKNPTLDFGEVLQAIIIFAGDGTLNPVMDYQASNTSNLNKYIIDRARYHDGLNFLSSSVTGGGVLVQRFDQLIIGEIAAGHEDPEEIAKRVLNIFETQGHHIRKNGKKLDSQEAVNVLVERVNDFFQERAELFKSLKLL